MPNVRTQIGMLMISCNKYYLPKVHPLVMTKFSVGHVAMVSDDLPDMLGWHVFLLCVNKPKLSLF